MTTIRMSPSTTNTQSTTFCVVDRSGISFQCKNDGSAKHPNVTANPPTKLIMLLNAEKQVAKTTTTISMPIRTSHFFHDFTNSLSSLVSASHFRFSLPTIVQQRLQAENGRVRDDGVGEQRVQREQTGRDEVEPALVVDVLDEDLADAPCVACGQCVAVCPTGALHEREEIDNVREAISDPDKVVVVAAAPAVRAAIGEEFGYPIGTNTEGKMFTAMRMLGFDKVFDVNFGADLTIMEEATELLERVKEGGVLPMFTSCSPGWIRYIEYYYPELIPNLSSCKSPMQMFGATVKTYWAQKEGIDPANIYVVGIMPCTAKKFEKTRDEESASGYPDVDAILTTRELAKMIRTSGILYTELPDSSFDDPLGEFTGAGVIFGATGGVMEAALRTAAETITGKPLDNIEFKEVRGIEGIKEAEYDLNGTKVKVAVASGLTNAKQLCDKIKSGECDYTFVEVMCCPGGCVNGGGQPIQSAYTRRQVDLRSARAKALYDEDAAATIRKSHENAAVQKLYKEFFHEPGSHKAHEILHTRYVDRKHKK